MGESKTGQDRFERIGNMKKLINIRALCWLALVLPLLQFPALGMQDGYLPLGVEVSPNIINIESERNGEIRIFTNLPYSSFLSGGGVPFIYFNGSLESIENIRATRDSLGNLILKFGLEALLELNFEENILVPDEDNFVTVVVSMTSGTEHSGDAPVYIVDKKAAERTPRGSRRTFR
jgi:hypothetical protein